MSSSPLVGALVDTGRISLNPLGYYCVAPLWPHSQMRALHSSLEGWGLHLIDHVLLFIQINSPVQTRVAGSGFHLPSAVHIALILSAGTNPGLHLKNISAPSVVFTNASMEPFPGTLGSLQKKLWYTRSHMTTIISRLSKIHLWLEWSPWQHCCSHCS